MAYIFVNVNRSVGTINPNIYGQFSEHLPILRWNLAPKNDDATLA